MKFRATLELAGKTATGFTVPLEVVTALGTSQRPAVIVTIGAHTYRSTVAPWQGEYRLPVSAENRAVAGISAGDVVEVELELDTAERTVEVPADLAAALVGDDAARTFFGTLSVSNQRWYTSWIEGAKKAETRSARVAKAVTMLGEGKKQG
jgi:hypothetical protein